MTLEYQIKTMRKITNQKLNVSTLSVQCMCDYDILLLISVCVLCITALNICIFCVKYSAIQYSLFFVILIQLIL